MDPIQPPPTYTPPKTTNSGVFGTKIPASVAFVIAVLLFFLPFAEVRCNGTALAQNSGFGIAIGTQWKNVMGGGMFGNSDLGGNNSNEELNKKQDPNIYAIAAMGLGVLGLLLSFAGSKGGAMGGLVTGLLSAGALIGLMIDLKNNPKLKSSDLNTPKTDNGNLGLDRLGNMEVTVDFTAWFYIAIIALLAAALFSYKRMQQANRLGT